MLFIEINARKRRLVLFLFFNKPVDTVKRRTAVIAYNSASAVGVGQTCYKVAVARLAHFFGICLKNAVVMRGSVFKLLFNTVAQFIAVCFACLARHTYAAERVYAPFKRAVGLHTHNYFFFLINISGGIRRNGRDGFGIYIKHAAELLFNLEQCVYPCHKLLCTLCGAA